MKSHSKHNSPMHADSLLRLLAVLFFIVAVTEANAQTTTAAWLNMKRNLDEVKVKTNDRQPATLTAVRELTVYWHGRPVSLVKDRSLADDDGFTIETGKSGRTITIRARHSRGLLYGAYHLLRLQTLNRTSDITNKTCTPTSRLRIASCSLISSGATAGGNATGELICTDEIDGEKGTMSLKMKETLTRQCRALASVGINGMVLRSNVSTGAMFSPSYISKVKVMAAVCRSYGIRLYLTVDPNSPETSISLTAIKSDGTSPEKWWRDKAKRLFGEVPDLGGFLVEAHSFVPANGMMTAAMTNLKTDFMAKAIAPFNASIIIARDVAQPQSLVFGGQGGSNGYKLDNLPTATNTETLLRNDGSEQTSNATFAPYLLSTGGRGLMVELICNGNKSLTSASTGAITGGWHTLLCATPQSRPDGAVLRYRVSADGYGLGREVEQKLLYYFGRLTWNCDITEKQLNGEWQQLCGDLKTAQKNK